MPCTRKPVRWADVEAVIALLPAILQIMVEVNWLTAMRPGEMVISRPCDVHKTKGDWYYHPEYHKTERIGHDWVIPLGPKAHEQLGPQMPASETEYIFSPRLAMAQ